jgi:hypothetical protein
MTVKKPASQMNQLLQLTSRSMESLMDSSALYRADTKMMLVNWPAWLQSTISICNS